MPFAPGHAQHVAEAGEDHLGPARDRDAVVDAPHRDHADRAAGPVHELDVGRQQVVDAVLVDRVRVAAAHLHDLVVAARVDRRGDLGRDGPAELGVAELVDVLHARSPAQMDERHARVDEHEIARGDLADELDVDRGVGLGGRGLVAAAREAGALESDDAQGEALIAAGDAVLVHAGRREPARSSRRSLDHARLQLLELLLVLGTHALEERERRVRLLLVDLREREAHVDEHPVAGLRPPPSSSSRPTLTLRRTPATSTRASRLASSTSSIT